MPSTASFTCRVWAWRPARRHNGWTRRLTKFFGYDDRVLDTERRELRRAAETERASDEHGRLGIAGATNIGDKVRLIPGHCDPTVNLCHWHVCIRGSRVEQLRPEFPRQDLCNSGVVR
jgi:D-serine deaminase-like pyridoxal phosphate-dependent protein